MKTIVIVILKLVALVFLVAAALNSGGIISGNGAGWLLAAGLATWCAASLIESLPIPENPPPRGTP